MGYAQSDATFRSIPADLEEALRDVIKGNNFKEDAHGYLVAYVDAEGLTSTEPDTMIMKSSGRACVF